MKGIQQFFGLKSGKIFYLNYLFGTANGALGNLGTKHLGGNTVANGIYQGVVSFQTETLKNITTTVGQ